jgi:hypothetical protein
MDSMLFLRERSTVMRTKALSLVLMLLLLVLMTAMGGKGGSFERAPRVDKSFGVMVTDVSGNKITGEKFSWEGRLHFSGNIGLASVTVPFDRIAEVTVGEKREKKVKATVRLRDGSQTAFEIDADSRCYGEAAFGSFMLMLEEIKSISFK